MRVLHQSLVIILLIVVGLSVGTAQEQAKVEVKKEMERLAGVWAPVSVESAGMKADGTDDAVKDIRYVFTKDGKFRMEKAGEAQLEGTYTVDPSKKPKQIDYKIEKAASEAFKDTTSLGIYELDGDMFKVCRTWPDNNSRPNEFNGANGTKQINSAFRREKK
jgi:uncharacterized protein (TIGR03067 family)